MSSAPSPSYHHYVGPSPPFLYSDPPLRSSSNPHINVAYPSASGDPQSSPTFAPSAFQGPYLAAVFVVLLITFFLLAAFSVYVRRYALALGNETRGRINFHPGQTRHNTVAGLDRAAIDGLPIVVYHRAKAGDGDAATAATVHEWSRRPDCVVCLTDFQEDEKLRLLPRCEHCFHPECIDMWLSSHTTCPLCRRSLLPVPPPLLPYPPPPPAPALP